MSWDVVLHHPAETPLGPAPQVRAAISAVHPSTDWSDPAWGTLEGNAWSIEFNTGASDPINSIMLHVRGSGDPLPAIAALCRANGWMALDMATGEPLDETGSGWKQFQTFRDEIAAALYGGTSLPRSGLRLEGTTLIRRDKTYDLEAAENLHFEPGYNWVSIILAALAFAAAVGVKLVIPIAWLGWTLAVPLALLGVLFVLAVRNEMLIFRLGNERIACPLIGMPEEIAAFRRHVEDIRG